MYLDMYVYVCIHFYTILHVQPDSNTPTPHSRFRRACWSCSRTLRRGSSGHVTTAGSWMSARLRTLPLRKEKLTNPGIFRLWAWFRTCLPPLSMKHLLCLSWPDWNWDGLSGTMYLFMFLHIQIPHKTVNLSFWLVLVNNKLTYCYPTKFLEWVTFWK